MFSFFKKKKPKIEFVNTIPGVAQVMPIIESKQYRHPWVDRALYDFSKASKDPENKTRKIQHISRCPGIFTIQRHGWILRTWQDIAITTDKNGIFWKSSSQLGGDAIHLHNEFEYTDYFVDWPNDTIRKVLKINTGWVAKVPDGYYLLEMHLPFYEESRFITATGYHQDKLGFAHLNPQLFWRIKEGTSLIKAGTPIAQYILVKKDEFEWLCGDVDKKELTIWNTYDESKFIKNYNEAKKFFSEEKK